MYFCIGAAMGAGLLLIFAKANARTHPSLEATEGTATVLAEQIQVPDPTPRPEADQPLADTATPVPVPTATSQEINGFIDRFSAQYGVDPTSCGTRPSVSPDLIRVRPTAPM